MNNFYDLQQLIRALQSIERQLKRGKEVKEHNKRVLEQGEGGLKEERVTDYSEDVSFVSLVEYNSNLYMFSQREDDTEYLRVTTALYKN